MSLTVAGDRLVAHFDRFDQEQYQLFLRCKRLPESQTLFHPADESYSIEAPARFATMLGLEVPAATAGDLTLSPFLFDDQATIVPLALAAQRFACWSGCGSGKTLIGLEWGRHVLHRTQRSVLIFTRNEIVQQWIEEAAKFYGDSLPIVHLRSRQQMKAWCASRGTASECSRCSGEFCVVHGLESCDCDTADRHGSDECDYLPTPGLGITNYEKLNYAVEGAAGQVIREFQGLGGIILDEGSRLRTSGGKQKWALIKSCEDIEYKLILTATPAPNDVFEFASQAGFLNKFRAEQSINAYFARDKKTHRWTVKPNARAAFFRFMAAWSIYVRDPKRYGWRLDQEDVPEPLQQVHEIQPTDEQLRIVQQLTADHAGQACLPGMADADLNVIKAMKLSQAAKGFLYRKGSGGKYDQVPSRKPAFTAGLIAAEASAGHQVLVWTVFDAESTILADLLRGRVDFDLMTGKTAEHERLRILERFRHGESRVLVSRAEMLGYGMNFQCCSSMVFSGWSFSYESWYQAIRRAYRYGQTQQLRVHVPVVLGLEEEMLETIFTKAAEQELAITEMERNYIEARQEMGK